VLTLTEAADELGLAASTLRHQVQAGRLRARLVGKTYVITERELTRYRAGSLGQPGRHQADSTRTAISPLKRSQRCRATST
jgi:excisionase family DNA binding protein